MKKISLFFFAACLVIFSVLISATSCKPTSGKKSYQAGVHASNSSALPNDELQFLFQANNAALYNLHLANEARIRSTAIESVALADNVINACSKIKDDVTAVADDYEVLLPTDITDEQKATWKELVKQKGWGFDKQFAVVMETNLKQLHSFFSSASGMFKHPGLQKIATEALMSIELQGNLALAQQEKIIERTGDVDALSVMKNDEQVASNTSRKKLKIVN